MIRKKLWLVLEEADVFAPQNPGHDQTRLYGEVDRIARRGRQFGFRLITLTQRPARLAKDVLTQLSTLVALGITSPQDRDAIKAWVEGNADRDQAKAVVDSLASLKVGEGWVWAPDLDLLKRVTFPPIRTLDTSATPKAGDKRPTATIRKDVDVAALRAALAAGAVKANVDKAGATAAKADASDLAAAEQRGYALGLEVGAKQGRRQLADAIGPSLDTVGTMIAGLRASRGQSLAVAASSQASAPPAPLQSGPRGRNFARVDPAGTREPAAVPGALSAGEASLVAALDVRDASAISWAAIALRAGYVATGGGFLTAAKKLRSSGLVEQNGQTYRLSAAFKEATHG